MIDIFILANSITIKFVAPANRKAEEFAYINYVYKDPYENPNKDKSFPYIDPPIGGWHLSKADTLPYYYDVTEICSYCNPIFDISKHTNNLTNTINFYDAPRDYRLKGNETIEFKTCVVDRKFNDKEVQCVKWFLDSNKTVKLLK